MAHGVGGSPRRRDCSDDLHRLAQEQGDNAILLRQAAAHRAERQALSLTV